MLEMTADVIVVRSKSPAGIEPRVERTAETIAKNGYAVKTLLWDRGCDYSAFERKKHFEIHRYQHKAPFGTATLLFHLPFWWLYEFLYLIRKKPEIVHACDFDTAIPAVFYKKLQRKKLVYDIFDIYGDMIAKSIPYSLRNFINFCERMFISQSDMTIIADESRIEQLKDTYIKKLVCIMNTPSIDDIHRIEGIDIKKTSHFSVFYGGMLSVRRGLIDVVNALKDLEDVKVVIAGYGADENILVPIFRKTANVTFIGLISHSEALAHTAAADITFALTDPNLPESKYASPNRLFEAMMFRKPIIVSADTAMAEIVKREKCGLVVPYGDASAFRNAVLKLKASPALCAQLGENGRKAFETKYNWQIMEKKLITAYRSLRTNI
jgi:glycosyltransferase involved in cell wall biosynthesis